ncbi:MerR family transcriptional regulator [Enterococcus sp. LJL98]
MRELFSINEIAEIFNTPKSTLRFWEEKGLIQPERNQENDYRMYDLKELIHVGDIVFYRSLGLSIARLQGYRQMDARALEELLTNAEKDVRSQLEKLQMIQNVLNDRQEKLSWATHLSETTYLEERPDFDYLVPYIYKEPFNHEAIQENDPYHFVLSITFEPEMQVQDGLVIPQPEKQTQLIWQYATTTKKFRTARLKIPADTLIQQADLAPHRTRLEQLGYHVVAIVARYLATINEETGRFEYYKAWFEIEEKGTEKNT